MLKRESTATAMCDGTNDPRMNVTIIDYGVGNLRSLQRGLERADATVTISDDPSDIAAAESLVLPGVGAFEECMRNSAPFHDVLVEKATDTPILGICVGLQLMFTESTEGAPDSEAVEGLDLLEGRVERLPDSVKVPHMGWNELTIKHKHPLVDGISDDDYAYFVHSYCSTVSEHTAASCDYGRNFAAVATNEAGNVMGTQFHPEKSSETGLRILQNFVDYTLTYYNERPAAAD
jgi:glutamine amidotransferase